MVTHKLMLALAHLPVHQPVIHQCDFPDLLSPFLVEANSSHWFYSSFCRSRNWCSIITFSFRRAFIEDDSLPFSSFVSHSMERALVFTTGIWQFRDSNTLPFTHKNRFSLPTSSWKWLRKRFRLFADDFPQEYSGRSQSVSNVIFPIHTDSQSTSTIMFPEVHRRQTIRARVINIFGDIKK